MKVTNGCSSEFTGATQRRRQIHACGLCTVTYFQNISQFLLMQSVTHLVWMVCSGGDAAKVTELHLILGVQQQVLQLHVSEKTK